MKKKLLFIISVSFVLSLLVSLFTFSASASIPQTEILFSQFTSGEAAVESTAGSSAVGNVTFTDNEIRLYQNTPLSPAIYYQAIRLNCNIAFPVGSNNDIITVSFNGKTTSPGLSQSGCNFAMRLTFEDANGREYKVSLGDLVGLNSSGLTDVSLTGNFNFPNIIGIIELTAVDFIYSFNSPITNPNVTITRSSFWVKSVAGSAQEAISESTSELLNGIVGDISDEDTSNLDGQLGSIDNQLGTIESITPDIEEVSDIFANLDQNYLQEADFNTYWRYWLNPLYQYFLPVGILALVVLFSFFAVIFLGKA